ncbi:MAG: hypothetical protein HOW73_00795 [Polyangiaceae bacterium]|nr:hypothetical protein [Polyangiaceae bacterium]
MPIPEHEGDLLPPFIGSPTNSSNCAPWSTDLTEVVPRFGTSRARREILAGLFEYRRGLRHYGIAGFQWLDGSFFDVMAREPRDVDVVTFLVTAPDTVTFEKLTEEARFLSLIEHDLSKEAYHVDPQFIDLRGDGIAIVQSVQFWYGLFSHDRTQRWRGILRIPLGPDDEEDLDALAILDGLKQSSP